MNRKRRNSKFNQEIEDFEEIVREKKINLGYKVNLKFKNKKQKEYYTGIKSNRIFFTRGAAGTGKTLIALLAALEMLKEGTVKKILITKPIVESSTSMGFLPGDMTTKISQYMVSFYSNIEKIIGKEWTNTIKQEGSVVEVPLNFMRGNTFGGVNLDGTPSGYFIIADEMQNATVREMKLLVSRLGEKSTMVIMGDTDQVDLRLRRGEKNGLDDAVDRLSGINGVGSIQFSEEDIVRDPFLIEIMKRYKSDIPK
jgi:phosphate starvation-inducible PhoH-like protein